MRIGDRAGRRANPDFARQQDMFRRREVAFDPRAQRFPKSPAHLAHRLGNRRQRRGSGAHPRVVVEADQRDIAWHAKAALGERCQHTQRREIRQRLNRGRRRIFIEPFREPCGRLVD